MIQRNIAGALKKLSESFPAVLVTGVRQTGKSTLLKECIGTGGCPYLTFDDVKKRQAFFTIIDRNAM